MITKIYIEGMLLDLFNDETMELNSSIANTDDITKINSDYTKSFTVPGSDVNNFIFKHYYDADIDNTFDARTKKNGYIELDGFPFKIGKIRLEKVTVKKGKPSSYTINFWGNLVNFKQIIKDDELTSLDLSDLDHEYNDANVKEGLINGLFGSDVVYNLFSQRRQYLYNSDAGDNTNTEKLVNIAYNGNDRGILWNELKASVRLFSIIEAIEDKYNFSFSRELFSRNEFKELYMWANKDKGDKTATSVLVDFDSGDNDFVDFTTDTFTCQTYINSSSDGIRFLWRFSLTPSVGFETVPYTVTVKNNGVQIYQQSFTGLITGFSGTLETTVLTTHNLTYHISSTETFSFNSSLNQRRQSRIVGLWVDAGVFDTEASEQTILSYLIVAANLPKIKVIDFLRGVFSMFKAVCIPQDDGTIYVNTLDDYYKEGVVRDFTKYIDFDSYDVERGKINNEIDFTYEPPSTILNKQFKENTSIAYGDELLSLSDEDGIPLDGEKLELKLPFEQVLFERLPDLLDGSLSNIQYGLILDDKLDPANPKPVIFYNNNTQLGTTSISFMNEDGDSEEINTTINTPAPTLGLENSTFSTLWGVEFSTWNFAQIEGTLFLNYWNTYITSIFNVKKRNFKFKAWLPIGVLTKLALNDIIFIKERYYRFNDFTVNLLTGESTLNLINSFEANFGLFLPSQTNIYLNYKAQTYNVYVSNGSVMNIVLQDLGFGTSWATAIQNGSSIDITVDENVLIQNRDLFINVDNGGTKSFQIYLNQDNKIVTFDSTDVTFDNDILTFDAI